jgi:tape measure domain-containing protein
MAGILSYALTLSTSGFTTGLESAKAQLANFQTTAATGGGGFGGIAAGAAGATAVIGGFTAALMASKAVLASYAEYDGLIRGLKTLEGTAGATQARLIELQKVAKLPGLGFEEAVRGDIRLRSAGISAELSAKSMKAFGNAIATVGGGKEQLDGVMLALTQIASKGKVSAEEINQINERVPQVRQAMLKAFGTADTEAIQKMGVTAVDFITRIASELGKLPAITGGARNALENFSDSWQKLKNSTGEFFVGASSGVLGGVEQLMNATNKSLTDLKELFGMKPAGLQGKDGTTEKERLAKEEAAAKLEAEQEMQAQLQEVHLANWDYQVALAEQWSDFKATRDQQDAARATANLEKVKAAQEAVFESRLTQETNLQRKIADLQSVGPYGPEEINRIAAGSDFQASVATRTAEIVRLQKELNDLRAAGLETSRQEAAAAAAKADAAERDRIQKNQAGEAMGKAFNLFNLENNLLGARATNNKKAIADAERALNMERLKAAIMLEQGMTEENAAERARNRLALEEAAAKAGDKRAQAPAFRNAEQSAMARAEALMRRQAADPKKFGNADKIMLERLQQKLGPAKLADAAAALARGAAAADPARNRREAAAAAKQPDPLVKIVAGIADKLSKFAIA